MDGAVAVLNPLGMLVTLQNESLQQLTPPLTPPASPLKPSNIDIDSFESLTVQEKINRPTEIRVAVIGCGYVGLHLVEAFSSAYPIIAFDVQQQRIHEIEAIVQGNVVCTSDPAALADATHFLVSVSTVLDSSNQVDTSCIRKAIDLIRQYARTGSTVVIESSVAVGMTRDLLQPLMQSKSLRCGMSPERVDPGRKYPSYTTIPKLISGLDLPSLSSIHNLYSRVFHNLVPVTSTETAEMTKLYENCQRMMCIAYANEMADACRQLSETLSAKALSDCKTYEERPSQTIPAIDPLEVARAAATKPFGYMPFSPSLGVGGHCIPVNPYYLLSNSDFPLLKACTESMRERPSRIGDRIMMDIHNKQPRRNPTTSKPTTPHVLVVGLGFKRGQSVLSNSPGKALAVHLLSNYDVFVQYADPLVEQSSVPFLPRFDTEADWNVETLREFDAIVVAVDQPGIDLSILESLRAQGVVVESFCRV